MFYGLGWVAANRRTHLFNVFYLDMFMYELMP